MEKIVTSVLLDDTLEYFGGLPVIIFGRRAGRDRGRRLRELFMSESMQSCIIVLIVLEWAAAVEKDKPVRAGALENFALSTTTDDDCF